MRPLVVIGAGRAGGSLAMSLAAGGWPVAALWSRRRSRARQVAGWIRDVSSSRPEILVRPEVDPDHGKVVLLAVPDDALAKMAAGLAASGPIFKTQVILHLSGAAGLEPLLPLAKRGAHTGSLHPLTVFTRTRPVPECLAGAGFAVDGDRFASIQAGRLVTRLKGISYRVRGKSRKAYHLAASLVANDTMALFLLALKQMESTGLPEKKCRRVLAHLLESAAFSLRQDSPVEALTGPVLRGDVETLRLHLAAAGTGTVTGRVHALLSQVLLRCAAAGGRVDASAARRVKRLLRPACR